MSATNYIAVGGASSSQVKAKYYCLVNVFYLLYFFLLKCLKNISETFIHFKMNFRVLFLDVRTAYRCCAFACTSLLPTPSHYYLSEYLSQTGVWRKVAELSDSRRDGFWLTPLEAMGVMVHHGKALCRLVRTSLFYVMKAQWKRDQTSRCACVRDWCFVQHVLPCA